MKSIICTHMTEVNRLLRSRLVAHGHETKIVYSQSQLLEAIDGHSETEFYFDDTPDALSCLQKVLTGKLPVSEFSPVAMLTNNKPHFMSGQFGAHCILQPPISLDGVDQSIKGMQSPKADFLFIDQVYIGLDRRQTPTRQRHNDRRLGQCLNEIRYRPTRLNQATVWKRSLNQSELIARLELFKVELETSNDKAPIIQQLADEMQNWGFAESRIHRLCYKVADAKSVGESEQSEAAKRTRVSNMATAQARHICCER